MILEATWALSSSWSWTGKFGLRLTKNYFWTPCIYFATNIEGLQLFSSLSIEMFAILCPIPTRFVWFVPSVPNFHSTARLST